MIRTAAQVTQAGKLSARRARNDGAESYRWLTDGRSLLLLARLLWRAARRLG